MILNLKEKVFSKVVSQLFYKLVYLLVLPKSDTRRSDNDIICWQTQNELRVYSSLTVITRDVSFRNNVVDGLSAGLITRSQENMAVCAIGLFSIPNPISFGREQKFKVEFFMQFVRFYVAALISVLTAAYNPMP